MMSPITFKNYPLVGNKVLAHSLPDSENLYTNIRTIPAIKSKIDAPKEKSAIFTMMSLFVDI